MKPTHVQYLLEPDWEHAPAFGRRETILTTLRRLYELYPGPTRIVEAGTLRSDGSFALVGDGWSSIAWGWYASQTDGRVYTVDVNTDALDVCRRMTTHYASVMEYVHSDSVAFLREWLSRELGPIHLLYLDSLDYIDYAASEVHCLAETEAAIPSLSAPGLVFFDDTWLTNGGADGASSFTGKGARAIPYLLGRGFSLEWAAGGQTLLSSASPTGGKLALA